MKKITLLFLFLLTVSLGHSQELVTNGDFQTGVGTPWYNAAVNVMDLGGGTWVNQANVLAAGNPWDVNMSQDIILENGKTYTLAYDAWTDATTGSRTIVAGLGQNSGPNWSNVTETPTLTATPQNFSHELTINYGDAVNDRVFFDMGAQTGFVFIDNVSVTEVVADAATDATLSNLTIDGTTVVGFSSATTTYNVELNAGTTVVPTVVGTTTQSSPATAITTAASSLPGSSTVLVTAQDGTTKVTYTINFTVATPISPPTTAAPTPPARNASDVVSIYSDAYAAISPINYDQAWCGAGAITGTSVEGDNIIAYNDKPCQGIGFEGAPQDVSGLTNLHVDLFIATGTDLVGKVFNVKIVYSAGGEVSFDIDINALSPAPVPGTWYSYDAEVNIAGSNIQQVGITSNLNNVVWYDNLYFWKESVNPLTDATLSDLQVDGETITDFSSDQISYSVVLPKGTTTIPQVTAATTTNVAANSIITQAPQLPGDATVVVTSEDTSTMKTYTISFSVDTNTACQGNSSEASEGSYSVGYNYNFETLETGNKDVKITFELLDQDKVGYVPQVFIAPSTFINMDLESGQIYTATLTDQTGDLEFSIRGAYSGGLVRSKVFEYTVGDTCELLGINDIEIDGLKTYPNPTRNQWTISTKDQIINSIEIFDVSGKKVISVQPNSLSANIDASVLISGMYISVISTDAGSVSQKLIKN